MKRFLCNFSAVAVCLGLCLNQVNGALVHEYLFDTDVSDTVGTADGTLLGTASVAGGSLLLTGGGAGDSYADLPDGIASTAAAGGNAGEISVEMTVTMNNNSNWAALFSFGNSGPDVEDNNGSDGDYWQLIPQNGANGILRTTTHIDGSEVFADDTVNSSALATGSAQHIVNVLNATADTNELYLNGVLVASSALQPGFDPATYGTVGDTQNWLGRSQWGDPSADASYDEFRIFDHALSAVEARDAYLASPVVPEPTTIAFAASAGIALVLMRRQRALVG